MCDLLAEGQCKIGGDFTVDGEVVKQHEICPHLKRTQRRHHIPSHRSAQARSATKQVLFLYCFADSVNIEAYCSTHSVSIENISCEERRVFFYR